MDTFLKTTGCVLAALIIYLILAKQNKDLSILLCVGVCVLVAAVAVQYLKPVFNFVEQLHTLGNLDGQMLEVLMKSVGIALISEIVELICQDSGNSSMGKTVQLCASGVILWQCVPMFSELLALIEEVLVAI